MVGEVGETIDMVGEVGETIDMVGEVGENHRRKNRWGWCGR